MPEPSIKGSIFGSVVDEIQALREQGRIDDATLDVNLEPADMELLDQKILTADWYPIASYARYLELLVQIEGGGNDRYLEERGGRSAQRLVDAGLYTQLDLLGGLAQSSDREGPDARERALAEYRSKLTVVLSMAGSIYNVGRWTVIQDPQNSDRIAIQIEQAESYSDGMVRAIVGFLEACARLVSDQIDRLYRIERPARDRIVLYMLEDLTSLRERVGARP